MPRHLDAPARKYRQYEGVTCDRLVIGINDDGIQKKLLAEPTLTYKQGLEIAQGCEEAEKNRGHHDMSVT